MSRGRWLADFPDQGRSLSLNALLRILVDVLDALGEIHAIAKSGSERPKFLGGFVGPAHVLVGDDGVARVALPADANTNVDEEEIGYQSPEVLLGDQEPDARADVFSVGVMLWEALTRQRLHAELDAEAIVVRVFGGQVLRPAVRSDESWAAPLADVAKAALSADLSIRYASVQEMAAAIRRIAGTRLASRSVVAELVARELRSGAPAAWPRASGRRLRPIADARPVKESGMCLDAHRDSLPTLPVAIRVPLPAPAVLDRPSAPGVALTSPASSSDAPLAVDTEGHSLLRRRRGAWAVVFAIGVLLALVVAVYLAPISGRPRTLALAPATPDVVAGKQPPPAEPLPASPVGSARTLPSPPSSAGSASPIRKKVDPKYSPLGI